jgi:hypothetical protein
VGEGATNLIRVQGEEAETLAGPGCVCVGWNWKRVDLSGEEGGEDESGAPVGAGEERWRRPLDLRREEVCSHGPCTADLRRER